MTDVLIVGAGPAGLTAAIYAARAGASALVFEKSVCGGQAALAAELDNYPSRPGLEGPVFAGELYNHAVSQGARVCFEEVLRIQPNGPVKEVITGGGIYRGRSLVLACGARRKRLGCPGEEGFVGRGVSFCASCDAAFFRGRQVAVVGGGDTALTDALLLSKLCEKVYLIHRQKQFRAQRVKQEAISARENIEIIAPATVDAVLGETRVDSLLLKTQNGQKRLAVSGVFVAVGLQPQSEIAGGLLPLTSLGYVDVGEDCACNFAGVYAAGDIRKKELRQIVTAAADGAVAGAAAAEYCNLFTGEV